jgi:alpha-tubulin suppressor-like RCC1 family protein
MSVLCRPDGSISFSVSESLLNTNLTQGDIIVFYGRPEGLEFIKEYDCEGFLESNFLNLLSSINISAIIKEIHFDSNHLEVIFISGLEKVPSLLGINNLSFFCPRLNQIYYLSSTLKETCFLSSRNNIWEKRSIYGSPISPNFKVGSGKYNFDNCNFYSFGFEGHENPSTSYNNKYVLISNQHVVYSSLDPISFLDGNLFKDQFTCEYDEIYSNSKRENILKKGIYFGQFVFPFEEYSDSNIRSFLKYIKKYQPSLYQNVYDNNTTLSDRLDFFKKLFAPRVVKFYSPKLKRYITRKIVMSLPAENYYREKYGIDHGISGVCVGLLDNPISIYETGIKPVAFHSEESSYLNFSENREVFYFDNYLRLSFAVLSNNFGVFKTKNDISLMKSKYVDMYDEFGSSYFGNLDIGNIVMCKGKSQSIIIGMCNGIENFQGIKGVKSNEICVNFGSDVKVKEFFGNAFKVPNRADPFILYGKSSYGDASSKFDFYRESYLECKNYNIFNQEYMYNFLSDFDYWKINSISEIWNRAFNISNIHIETDVMEYSTGSRSPVIQRSSMASVVSDENYASISHGYAGVIFYTTRDGTVKYIVGYNANLDLPEDERNVVGAGIRNVDPFSATYESFQAGQGGVDLTPPSDLPKCKQVVTGYRNAHALTVNDSIVSWDGNPNQQWKKTSEIFMQQLRYYQEPGRRLEGVKIKKISSGAGFVAVLLTNGEVIIYGANESAQMSDVDTVLAPIGIIPLPVRGDNFYIKKWKSYKTWKYGENLSTYLDSLSSPNSCVTQQEISEDADDDFPDVDSGTNSHWRLYRSAALGCEQHEGSGAIADSPYINGSNVYPPPPVSWSGFLDWSSLTGAPNDYQFSRSTTGDASSVNFSFGASWTRSPDRIPMTVVYPCTTDPDGECSYVSNGYERPEGHPLENDRPPNSLFGFSGNRYRDVSSSRSHVILLTENGNLETWGTNWYYNVTGSGPQFGDFRRTGSGIPGGDINDAGWSTPGHPRPFPDAPWGDNSAVEVKRLKTTSESLLGIGSGYYISIVIRADGSIFAWDRNEWGESLPRINSDGTPGLPSGIFKQVNSGYHHSIALREDGTVVCWGENNDGECNVPSILKNPTTSNCGWVCAFKRISFALRNNGDLIGWGNTDEAFFGFKGFTSGSVFNPGEPILLTFADPSSSSSSSSSPSSSSSSSSSSFDSSSSSLSGSSSSSSSHIEYDPYSEPQPRSTVAQIESAESSFVNEEFGINYFKGVFGGAVYDSVEINFRDIVKVMAKADSINGIIKFIGNTKFAKYDKLIISLSSVSHSNSGDVDHITVEDSFEGVNAGLPSLLSRVVHSNINVSSAFIVSSEFGSDFEGFQSFIVSNNDPNKISYDTSDFNKKQLFASSEFSVNENFINSMLFDEEQNSVLLGGKFGVYKFSLDSKNLTYDVRFMGSADCLIILQTSVEIIAVCSGGIYVYSKYRNSNYVINLMGFPFKVCGGFITSQNDLAVLTSGGIFIKNKDANQIYAVLQDIVSSSSSSGQSSSSSGQSSSSSGQSSSSSGSSSSSSYSNFVSFYKGIGYQLNFAFTDKNLYFSSQISQWGKFHGVLPSISISDVVIFGNNLYICTSSGLYVNKLSSLFLQPSGPGALDFKKVILDINNQNLSINALGASYSFDDEGGRVDQLMLAGDEKGKIYSIIINNDGWVEQVTSTVQTEFSVIHKVLRVEDDWILSSYNQFKLLSNDKIYTLSLGIDV